MTPASMRAWAALWVSLRFRSVRWTPVTMTVRRLSSMLWCIQPWVPCQSRTLRQVRYSAMTSRGRSGRTKTHSTGYWTPGPVRMLASLARRLTKRGRGRPVPSGAATTRIGPARRRNRRKIARENRIAGTA